MELERLSKIIKNKASRANLDASIFNYKQSIKKFKKAVDKLDKK